MLAKILDKESKKCDLFLGTDIEYAKSEGYSEMDVEKAYNGSWYVKGYAPEKPRELKEESVKAVRAKYFEDYIDFYQSKPLYWEELAEPAKQNISEYRVYLKDYTKEPLWYEQNPLSYEEWLKKKYPQETFYLNNL